jgi:hypothetical protein
MTRVSASPFFSARNGNIERWHQNLKRECMRAQAHLCLDAERDRKLAAATEAVVNGDVPWRVNRERLAVSGRLNQAT